MERRYTKNHIALEIHGKRARIGPSAFLLQEVGSNARVRLDPIGSVVRAGAPFGRIEGSRSACHLYAPFALKIVAHEGAEAEVEIGSEPREEIFDHAAYEQHVRSAPE
jgi:glycine cleavage system H protein